MTPLSEILRRRALAGTRTPHGDGAKVALCIEGGAMRGVIAAGMVTALEELGLTHAFDGVFGSSAGAICGAYFLSEQAEVGAKIFTEDINNRRFASRLRTFSRWPIVNLNYLVDEVMVGAKRLDTGRVLASKTPLMVVATDVASAATALLQDFVDGDELRAALRAGATMPIIAGPPHPFRGRRYFDASLTEPIPVPSADRGGFTHIVVLLTRPRGVPRAVSRFDRLVVGPRLARVSAPLAEGYLSRTVPYQTLQDEIASGRTSGGAVVLGIRPDLTVSKLERDRTRLLAGAASGRAAVHALLK